VTQRENTRIYRCPPLVSQNGVACHPAAPVGRQPDNLPLTGIFLERSEPENDMQTVVDRRKRMTRENSRTSKLQIRVNDAEKQAFAEAARRAGMDECELLRRAVESVLGTGIDERSAELLRIMGEIVQQNILLAVQQGRPVDRDLIEYFEREAARLAPFVLDRRRHLLEAIADREEGAA
jgi:hypothetical protein